MKVAIYSINWLVGANKNMFPTSRAWSDLQQSSGKHRLNIQASNQIRISLFKALVDLQNAIYCINWLVGAGKIMLPCTSSWPNLHWSTGIHPLNMQTSYQVIVTLFRAWVSLGSIYSINWLWGTNMIMFPCSSSWSDLHWSTGIHRLNIWSSNPDIISLFGALTGLKFTIYSMNWVLGTNRIILPCPS